MEKTVHERVKGKRFKVFVAEFGECVWYLKPGSKSVDKLFSRWEQGVFLGVRDESGESIIGTKDGVIKVRSFRRRASKEQRWNREVVDSIRGSPWEPIPGREGIEIKTSVCIPCEEGQTIEREDGVAREVVRRRFHIRAKDVEKYKPTMDCEGCKSVNRGGPAINHSIQCRDRFARLFTDAGDPRISRESERLATQIAPEADHAEQHVQIKTEDTVMTEAGSDERPTELTQTESMEEEGVNMDTDNALLRLTASRSIGELMSMEWHVPTY